MSAPEARAALVAIRSIPRDVDGPVFPAPWAARAFVLAVALNERGLFTWPEWSETLGAKVALATFEREDDPEAFWEAWLGALEDILGRKSIAEHDHLLDLKDAWRRAAEATPHGEPIELSSARQA